MDVNNWTPQQFAAYNEYIVQQMQLTMPLVGQQMMQPWAGTMNVLQQAPQIVLSENEDNDNDSSDNEELRTLFIANLDERVTEEVLYEVFLQAGPIESVRIPKDNTGKQRTFGFVTYVHLSAPPYAMHLYQGLELFRKRITVKFRKTDQAPKNVYTLPEELEAQFGNRTIEETNNRLSNGGNPFAQDLRNTLKSRHGRHSFHDAKPYDRNPVHMNRRSDSMVDRHRDWDRSNRMQPYHNGGNRRSDQRSGGGVHRR